MRVGLIFVVTIIYLFGIDDLWATASLPTAAQNEVGNLQRTVPILKHDGVLVNGVVQSSKTNAIKNSNPTIGSIVEGILQLEPQKQLKLITKVMLKSQFSNGIGRKNHPTELGQVFDVLNSQFDHLQDDLSFDALIIRYLVLSSLRFKQTQSGRFEDGVVTDSIKTFFKNRLAYWVAHKSVNLVKLFDIYGELLIISNNIDWLLNEGMDESLLGAQHSIQSEDLNEGGKKFKSQILFTSMNPKIHPSEANIEDVLSNINEQLGLMIRTKSLSLDVIHWINTFNFYIDWVIQNSSDSLNISFERLTFLLDQRISINRDLAAMVHHQIDQFRFLRININDTHPLLKSYLRQVDPSGQISNTSFDLSLSEMIGIQFRDLETKLSKSAQMVAKYHQLRELDLALLHFEIPRWSLKERIAAYHISQLSIEFGRNLLLNKSRQNSLEGKTDYVLLRKILQEALCIRYFEKYQGHTCELIGELASHRSDSTTQELFRLRNLADEIKEEKGVTYLIFEKSMSLGPGIYISDSEVTLKFKDLSFHPLAMIYTNGKSVRVNANQIDYAWLDASGVDQVQDHLAPPTDGLPSREDGFRGRAPSKPIQADAGGIGGSINIDGLIRNSLLAAFGGDAENGFDGAESPNCILSMECLGGSGPFKLDDRWIESHKCSATGTSYVNIVHRWSVIVSSRGRDCSRCYVGPADICNNDGNRRRMCGSDDVIQNYSEILHVNAGPGGDGGNAGSGGDITVRSNLESTSNFIINISGRYGAGGKSGTCGPHPVDGEEGQHGIDGKIQVLEGVTK